MGFEQFDVQLGEFFRLFMTFEGVHMYYAFVIAFFVVLLIADLIFDVATGDRRKMADFYQPAVNISFLIITNIIEMTAFSVILAVMFIYFGQFALFEIPINVWSWAACILLVDFCYYWTHRMEHSVRLFWTHHSVHHSSEEFTFTTGVRVFWFLSGIGWAYYIPVVLLGFAGPQVLGSMIICITYTTWIHTDKITRIPIFEKVFNTPSFHRVHHGRNRQYIDKNYAAMFVFWDKMFGTYEPEGEKVRFGITVAVKTANPIKVGFMEFYRLGKDMINAGSIKNALGYMVNGPGWKPKGFAKKDTQETKKGDDAQTA